MYDTRLARHAPEPLNRLYPRLPGTQPGCHRRWGALSFDRGLRGWPGHYRRQPVCHLRAGLHQGLITMNDLLPPCRPFQWYDKLAPPAGSALPNMATTMSGQTPSPPAPGKFWAAGQSLFGWRLAGSAGIRPFGDTTRLPLCHVWLGAQPHQYGRFDSRLGHGRLQAKAQRWRSTTQGCNRSGADRHLAFACPGRLPPGTGWAALNLRLSPSPFLQERAARTCLPA